MLYQLPNGKVIQLTLDEFFSLTNDDIQDLTASGYGEEIRNPFFGSVIKKPCRIESDDDNDFEDSLPEFIEEDADDNLKFDINNIPDETSEF
jgi:hypothetical protein